MKVYTLVLSYPHEGGNLRGVSASQKALEAMVEEAIISCFSDVSDSPDAIKEMVTDMGWSIERFVANESGDVVYKMQSKDRKDYGCYYIQEWEVTKNENHVHDPMATAEGAEADKKRRSPRLS